MNETPRSVMIVDDDVDFLETLGLVLQSRGYRVDAECSAESALERLAQGERPSLILLDLMMPGMSGWEFRERQLAASELAPIPVVVLSGDHMALRRSPPVGCSACLGKPVELLTLLDTVDRCATATVA